MTESVRLNKCKHQPQMFNSADAIGYQLLRLNDDEQELFNLCKKCGCLYPAESYKETGEG